MRVRGILAVGLAVVVFLSVAWLDDDAFVTFRTVDNLLEGHGARWNVAERVQAYTHPLWMLLHAGLVALTGHHEATSIALSLVLSTAFIVLLVFRAAPSVAAGTVAVGCLLVSKAWVDYSSSGLENPLTRLLLLLFFLNLPSREVREVGERRGFVLCLFAALASLSRPDALLVFLPSLVVLVRRRRGSSVPWALGFAPLGLWGLFALFYYGSPWPNTAFAKLGTGVPRLERIAQGLGYLLDSLVRDPATLILCGLAAFLAWRRPREVHVPLLAGGLLYLAYVVWIGGSYMSGRFLGLPLTVALLAVLRGCWFDELLRRPRALRWALAGAILCLVVRVVEPNLQRGVGLFAVGDERRTHHPYTGLAAALLEDGWPRHHHRFLGEKLDREKVRVTTSLAIGMAGFYAGPDVHLVDRHGLADPLLARLPGRREPSTEGRGRRGWRPGHLVRPLPEGYLESLPNGKNRIVDPDLREYYDVLRSVTRDPLWDRRRLTNVLRLNLGLESHRIDAWIERHSEAFGSSE